MYISEYPDLLYRVVERHATSAISSMAMFEATPGLHLPVRFLPLGRHEYTTRYRLVFCLYHGGVIYQRGVFPIGPRSRANGC